MKISFQLLKEPQLMRGTEQGISKTSSKVNRIVGNPAGKEFDS